MLETFPAPPSSKKGLRVFGAERSAVSSRVLRSVSSRRRRRVRSLEHTLQDMDLRLDDLSSVWIDALDDWQCALRDGATIESEEWQRLQEVEASLHLNLQRQKRIGESMQAALDNLG